MIRPRTWYRVSSGAFVLLLVWVAFFGAYSGTRHGASRFTVDTSLANGPAQSSFSLFGMTLSEALLAAFTLGLLIVGELQRRQLRRTNEHSATNERPYLFASVILPREVYFSGDGSAKVTFELQLRNHGKTPAILKRFRALMHLCEEYPSCLPPTVVDKNIPPGKVIGAGDLWPYQDSIRTEKTNWANVAGGNMKLICLGEVVYFGVDKIERKMGFCWEFVPRGPDSGIFEISPSNKLNHYT